MGYLFEPVLYSADCLCAIINYRSTNSPRRVGLARLSPLPATYFPFVTHMDLYTYLCVIITIAKRVGWESVGRPLACNLKVVSRPPNYYSLRINQSLNRDRTQVTKSQIKCHGSPIQTRHAFYYSIGQFAFFTPKLDINATLIYVVKVNHDFLQIYHR